MRTSKPFSTISYNSDTFLSLKLVELCKNGVIDFYAWIQHLPEIDETKTHKHLHIIPSKLIDTRQFQDYLYEIDSNNPLKPPLGCIVPRPSKWADWYFYALHDVAYLASKGQTRQYHYQKEEIKVSCNDYFAQLVHTIDYSKYALTARLLEQLKNGITAEYLITSGQIPLPMIGHFLRMCDFLNSSPFCRNDRVTHTAKTEIID